MHAASYVGRIGWRLVCSAMLLCGSGCAAFHSLSPYEQAVFYRSVGHRDPQGGGWMIPVRGWVYEDSWLSRNLSFFGRVFDVDDLVPDRKERRMLRDRLRPFFVDNETRKSLNISVGEAQYRLKPTRSGGHVADRIRVTDEQVRALGVGPEGGPGRLTYRVATWPDEDRLVMGEVLLLDDQGLSVASDIDDTVRVTEVNNTRRMLRNTFLQPFVPVPGMAEVYAGWAADHGAEFHYLSTSPCQLYEPVVAFLDQEGFPEGSMHLKAIKREGGMMGAILDMFEAPRSFKYRELEVLLAAFPNRRFVLVGDSAQEDPEIYADVARAFPGRIQRILIRNVTCEGAGAERYKETFRDLPPGLWVIFDEAEEMRSAGIAHGPES